MNPFDHRKLLQDLYAKDVTEAVKQIIPYLVDKTEDATKNIYFDGWVGLGASAVLRSIARDSPSDLKSKFSKIIHIDCSSWKSRRALQRTIVEELKLPQWVMAIFDRQDEEDDFRGIDESSRLEIEVVGIEVHRALQGHKLLVVFHNGSNGIINLHDFGISQPSRWTPFDNKTLWTFGGRLILGTNLDVGEHLKFCCYPLTDENYDKVLREEASEIATYTRKVAPRITDEIASNCCLYLLTLHYEGGNIIEYNWAGHASNYWVCDGIIQGGGQAWQDAAALHQEIRLDGYTSDAESPWFCRYSRTPPGRWMFVTDNKTGEQVPVPIDQTTSFFLANITTIPIDMFHQATKLRVLKLCRCAFSFSTPPFYSCHNLRFLGLDACKDIMEAQSGQGRRQEDTHTKNQAQVEQEGEKKDNETVMGFFQSLWVLDICSTDWTLPGNALDKMAANIREINIRNGRIWGSSNLAWRRLRHNLHKLRVIEPISSWETGQKDEFMGMVNLELLDLTGNLTIQVFPNLSGATSLKTLILDGCVGLEQIGPQKHLPLSVESISFDAGPNKSCEKLSKISLEGCNHLEHLKLKGKFPCLEELDLSRTSLKVLDLSAVEVTKLHSVVLMGCKQLRAILWWATNRGVVEELRIDTNEVCDSSSSLLAPYCNDRRTIVVTGDVKFIKSLWQKPWQLITPWSFYLNLQKPAAAAGAGSCSTAKGYGSSSKKKMESASYYYHYERQVASVLVGALTTVSTSTSIDALLLSLMIEGLGAAHDHDDDTMQTLDRHVEIGPGVSLTDVESPDGIKDVFRLVTARTDSLHVHDNSSMTSSLTPKFSGSTRWPTLWTLKLFLIERCPKLQVAFAPFDRKCDQCFSELYTILAAHLLSATCIWRRGILSHFKGSIEKLRSIHICFCPRLKFVLPLSEYTEMPRLEILHVVSCGDLRHIFPLDENYMPMQMRQELLGKVKFFPSLKRICLHDLPSLEQVCEFRMVAPALETITMRGCWSLRRLPAVGQRGGLVKVDCEKDVWERLEWDGLGTGHHPSLFRTRHPTYYRNKLPRGSLLR